MPEDTITGTDNFYRSILEKFQFQIVQDRPDSIRIPDRPDETGWDRICQAWRSFNNAEKSIEFQTIFNGFSFGGLFGFCFGAFTQNREVFNRFVEIHNTNVFEGKHKANRQLVDTMYLELFRRSTKHAIRYGLFSGSFVTALTLAITYRNDIYYRDCAMAGAITGTVWKAHLGLRAVLVNATLGSLFGLTFAGIARAILKISGTSIKELRYLQQTEFEEQDKIIYENQKFLKN